MQVADNNDLNHSSMPPLLTESKFGIHGQDPDITVLSTAGQFFDEIVC